MTARRLASEVVGAVGLIAWLVCAGIAAGWRKLCSTYLGQLVIILVICGALGIGFALAF